MENLKDGGPAFPGPDQMETEKDIHEGMSLRDYFAAKAMQAALSRRVATNSVPVTCDHVARHAYRMADAMIRARES